ncbi:MULTISPECIES: hypothetical protein [unclassified Streptomyces]|uniref:hypothetical protein n=1 Tax=unclassified Streptomyces TaxID=2593676 RepID=UPI002E128A3B|nr:hypothetical protein OG466_40275 [Streptomyces sp. NBC_01240]
MFRIRIITGRTHRRHQEQVRQAAKVPGLESELTSVTTQLDFHRGQTRTNQTRLRQSGEQFEGLRRDFEGLHREHAALRQDLEELAASLVAAPDAETARRETARVLSRHFENAEFAALAQPVPAT